MPPHERMFHHHHAHKLEDPDREKMLPPADVLARLALAPGMRVADVGAGTGFFAIPLARAVSPGGRVFAVDLQPEMLERLRAKLTPELPVELVRGSANETTVADASVDLVFYANVWHELDDRPGALAEAKRILRPGGRVAIVDWRPAVVAPGEEPPPGPPLDHRVSADDALAVVRAAGFSAPDAGSVGQHHYIVVTT